MNTFKVIRNVLFEKLRPIYKGSKLISRFLPNEAYVRLKWHYRMGRKPLNLKHPKSFNEKLQWLKLHDKHEEYTKMVDKCDAKNYVASIIGEKYIIPTLGVYSDPEEIDLDKLPNEFVLKCTHDCGSIIVCKDKSHFDFQKAKSKLAECLKHKYYYESREYPYKNVKPRIIAEKFMVDESGYELKDYKWFCFDGNVKYLFIAKDRTIEGEETKFDFFDNNFNHLPFTNGHPNAEITPQKPKSFEEMKELAAKLSKGKPFVRVDFYDINGQIYFGELTFFHWGGMMPFEPESWDYEFGKQIKLPIDE